MQPAKESNNSATVWHRIAKFHTDIHADLVYSRTGYDVQLPPVGIYQSSTKQPKMPPPTAMSRILVAPRFCQAHPIGGLLILFKTGSNFEHNWLTGYQMRPPTNRQICGSKSQIQICQETMSGLIVFAGIWKLFISAQAALSGEGAVGVRGELVVGILWNIPLRIYSQ